MGADLKSSPAQSSTRPDANASRRRRPNERQSPVPASASQSPAFLATQSPSHDEIARRAFAIYDAEGRPQGRAAEHWERAEQELLEQSTQKSASSSFTSNRATTATTSGSTTAKAGERPSGWPLSAAYER